MAFSGEALRRGMARRCARCGTGGIFRSYYRLHPTCPACGMRFEREDGEWTGALTVIMAVTELIFAVFLGVGLWLTWPAVPWTWLLVGGVVINVVVPVLLYPWSQSVWIGLHYAFVPLDAAEEAAAIAARAADGAATGGTGGTGGPQG
jgi:uncharacterized protein (DUF983 family)